MNILENKLVRKYFHPECNDDPCYLAHSHYAMVALQVLRAMQEPIRKGDRRLYIDGMGAMWDGVHPVNLNPDYHPDYLRLPDKFQMAGKKECKNVGMLTCQDCGSELIHQPAKEPFSLIHQGPHMGTEKCGDVHACEHGPAFHDSDAVEAKIDAIELKVWKFGKATVGEAVSLGKDLHELVNLVRGEK